LYLRLTKKQVVQIKLQLVNLQTFIGHKRMMTLLFVHENFDDNFTSFFLKGIERRPTEESVLHVRGSRGRSLCRLEFVLTFRLYSLFFSINPMLVTFFIIFLHSNVGWIFYFFNPIQITFLRKSSIQCRFFLNVFNPMKIRFFSKSSIQCTFHSLLFLFNPM
jgi:hypothetical protein